MRRSFLILSALLLLGGSALAEPPKEAVKILKHLEFLGYNATMDSKHIIAKHSEHLNFYLKQYRGGMLLTSFFTSNAQGKKHRKDLIRIANDLNKDAAAARYYIDKDGDLAIEAYYPGGYERQRFGLFLDTYNLESENIANHKKELVKYLE
ncbi:hypothetical protein [Nitratifractor salsuginis]|uniref:Uncharacterized protein n=1 Tax=Nitratifractor salsuginis (strain DSM 16511 / JCM 12458 / E9I37-1) TaxID=749222 RepID=E6X2S0_NITSE|nr:hypothetical protein [Nitratifractor salsuginis]ADV46136.1 hypothetical protein Nitsa_0876 [Nitratifractor salsuginis DSM 16511]